MITESVETTQQTNTQTFSEIKIEGVQIKIALYNGDGIMIESAWSTAPLSLEKCILDDFSVSTFSSTGVDTEMRYRISRRVTINGAVRWIYANTEQEYADKIISLYCQSNQLTTPKEKHNFREYALKWFETYSAPNVATVTATTYDRQITKYLLPAFGNMDIEDISTSHVQQFFNSIDGAKSTKNKIKIVLNQVFQSALDDGIVSKNPLKSSRLRIEGNASKEIQPYTVEEMQYLSAHIGDIKNEQDRLYLALQALHPLRLEEVLGLRWEDVDFEKELLYIRRAVTHPDRNQPEIKEPKTEKSKRAIGLSAITAGYLSLAKNKNGFVVGGDVPLSYTMVRRMCERIQRDTQFEGKITPIRFRTTVLTDLYNETKDIKLTQSMAGHTTSAMTLKYYVKGRESAADSVRAIDTLYTT